MAWNKFEAKCYDCQEQRPDCVNIVVLGTNVYQQAEWRHLVFCEKCYRECRKIARIVLLHPKHKKKRLPEVGR